MNLKDDEGGFILYFRHRILSKASDAYQVSLLIL